MDIEQSKAILNKKIISIQEVTASGYTEYNLMLEDGIEINFSASSIGDVLFELKDAENLRGFTKNHL